jgi:lipopolysaccharide/colanic/teichoic acid biosynthesis glycosyltransferase
LELKPGVTGLSQLERVHGTTELETSRRHIDLVYRDQCSFTLDSKILLKTIFEGILGRNAY